MTSRLPILDRAPEQKTRKEKSKGASGGWIENGRRRAVWRCRRSRGAIAGARVREHGEEDCRRHDVNRMRKSGDGLALAEPPRVDQHRPRAAMRFEEARP